MFSIIKLKECHITELSSFKFRPSKCKRLFAARVLALTSIFTNVAYAESLAQNSLFELSLEELLNVRVITPSKTLQSLSDSPGVVTTFSDTEISLFGGSDLGEVLSRIIGFKEYGSLGIGRSVANIRSDMTSFNNNHVLFLLNGTPLNRESYTGGIWNQSILLTIPLDSVKRLEVTRGPGSVLYGTNAFAGVVNIITNDANEQSHTVSVSYGNDHSRALNASSSGHSGDWQWTSALRFHETNGWPFSLISPNGDQFSGDADSESPGVIATATNQHFSGTVYWGKAKQLTIRGTPSAPVTGEIDNEKYYIDLAYKTDIGNDWTLKTSLSHVGGRTDHNVASQAPGQLRLLHYETNDSRLEVTASGDVSSQGQMVLGATFDYFSGESDILPTWHQYLLGYYAQYEYQLKATKFIIGAQFNKAEDGYKKLVPRLGIVHHFNDIFGLKFLYGEAFRAPYVVEREINVSIAALSIIGDESLDPELVTTWDLQLFYEKQNLSVIATVFRNEQEDLIVRHAVSPNLIRFTNKGELTIKGIELETKYTYADNWFFTGNYSYQRNRDGDGIKDYSLQPDYEVKVGVGYTAEQWSLGIYDTYSASYHENNLLNPPGLIESNPEANSHHRFSANLRISLNAFSGWGIEAYADNLLDEDVFVPSYPGDPFFTTNTRMQNSGRSYMIKVSKEF